MNTTSRAPSDFPRAKVKRQAVLSLIWLVPLIAAVVAGVLVFQNLQKFGPDITIQFQSASGLDANQTVIRYRGVRVGSVQSIRLTRDLRNVEVRARLYRFAAGLAREVSVFWIVRPEVGAAGVHALETIVSGPYIEALPEEGQSKSQNHFVGAEEAPVIKQGNGIEFVLHSAQVRSLSPSSPVYYRGLQAGKVQYLELSEDATTVNIHVLMKPSFAPLVRLNSVWWNAGGIDINWHLLSGLSMTAENLRAVVTGGIAFATPNEPDEPARSGMAFTLHVRPDEKWLEWAPRIAITNAAVSSGSQPSLDLENVSQTPKQ